MNAAYLEEVRAHCPQTQIVYDLFHVVARYGREVIDRVRVDEANRLRRDPRARRPCKPLPLAVCATKASPSCPTAGCCRPWNMGRGRKPATRYQQLACKFPGLVRELKKKGVTLQWLWERYIQEQPKGYQYSQYCWHFHRWRKGEEVVMHIEHKAGQDMFVDWAGDKLEVINGNTGQPWQLEQFVAILGPVS